MRLHGNEKMNRHIFPFVMKTTWQVRCCWYCLLYMVYCTILDVYHSDFIYFIFIVTRCFLIVDVSSWYALLLPLFFAFYLFMLWLRVDVVTVWISLSWFLRMHIVFKDFQMALLNFNYKIKFFSNNTRTILGHSLIMYAFTREGV